MDKTSTENHFNLADFIMEVSENGHDLQTVTETARIIRKFLDQIDADPKSPGRLTPAQIAELMEFIRTKLTNPHDQALAYRTAQFFYLNQLKSEWDRKVPGER